MCVCVCVWGRLWVCVCIVLGYCNEPLVYVCVCVCVGAFVGVWVYSIRVQYDEPLVSCRQEQQ